MTSNNRIGYVYVKNIYAGKLEETDEGYVFTYFKSIIFIVSYFRYF